MGLYRFYGDLLIFWILGFCLLYAGNPFMQLAVNYEPNIPEMCVG